MTQGQHGPFNSLCFRKSWISLGILRYCRKNVLNITAWQIVSLKVWGLKSSTLRSKTRVDLHHGHYALLLSWAGVKCQGHFCAQPRAGEGQMLGGGRTKRQGPWDLPQVTLQQSACLWETWTSGEVMGESWSSGTCSKEDHQGWDEEGDNQGGRPLLPKPCLTFSLLHTWSLWRTALQTFLCIHKCIRISFFLFFFKQE